MPIQPPSVFNIQPNEFWLYDNRELINEISKLTIGASDYRENILSLAIIQLLLALSQQESSIDYTDGFRAYEPLEDDNAFTREYVVHDDSEYVDGDVHVNTYESHV